LTLTQILGVIVILLWVTLPFIGSPDLTEDVGDDLRGEMLIGVAIAASLLLAVVVVTS
jgi:hypothetical protein